MCLWQDFLSIPCNFFHSCKSHILGGGHWFLLGCHITTVIASSMRFILHCPQRNMGLHNYKLATFSLFIHCIRAKNIARTSQILKSGHCLEQFLFLGYFIHLHWNYFIKLTVKKSPERKVTRLTFCYEYRKKKKSCEIQSWKDTSRIKVIFF